MNTKTLLVLPAALLLACGGRSARADADTTAAPESAPTRYTYRVVASYPHPADAYTQGLFYADGILWEGTGQYGQSLVRKTDLATGRSQTVARLPRSQFGEGIALLGDKLYQLTWQANTCHVYDAATLQKLAEFRYPGEGWGLTADGEKLYMTDGSARIHTLDPATFRREKRITVTLEGRPVDYLNEIEWIEGKIWANVYTSDLIVIIDPATGRVEGVVDLTGLLPEELRGPETDVLNGIAYDAAEKRIFVTGKNWSRIFQIELIEQ